MREVSYPIFGEARAGFADIALMSTLHEQSSLVIFTITHTPRLSEDGHMTNRTRKAPLGAVAIIAAVAVLMMSGCSQDREERREIVKGCLLAPLALAAWCLDSQSDPKDDTQEMIDRQNSLMPGAGPAPKRGSGEHPDVQIDSSQKETFQWDFKSLPYQ